MIRPRPPACNCTNIFGIYQLTRAVLPHLKSGTAIINTTSITAYKGNPTLLDYSATKGAITAFTRSLSINLAPKGIRVKAWQRDRSGPR